MVFPQTVLPSQVDISLDGTTWTDITSDVRGEDRIRITRGRSDWGQQADAGRCSFSLSNTDGKYSPRNAESPYYGQIGRNTPVRVSVNTGSVALWLPATSSLDSATTPDTAALDITGDIDVRIDATLLNWYLADGALGGGSESILTELIGKYAVSTQASWALYTQYGALRFAWSEDGTTGGGYVAISEKVPVPASGHLAVRVTLDVDNGAGGFTARFYTAESIDGPWVQLGTDLTGGATTSIFAGTAPLIIGNAISGELYDFPLGYVHAAEVRSGIGGTVVADPDFTAQTSGATSFADSAGLTWTVGGIAELTDRKVRFVGEIASWTPVWDTGGKDVVTKVEAAGVMRRLGQGVVPAKSPMYREFTSPARTSIVAYWPMEDGADATSLASALDGHPAMRITGAVTPAAYDTWPASDPVPTVGTGSLRVSVPTSSATGVLFLRVFAAVPAAGVVSTQRLLSLTQSGTAKTWSVYVNTAGSMDLRAYDAEGTQILAHGFSAFDINGRQKSVGVELTQDGADIDYKLFSYDIEDSTLTAPDATSVTGTLAGYTVGVATQVRFGEDGAMNGTAFGHLAISDSALGFASTSGPLLGWTGETAAARVHRLGVEENLAAYATSHGDEQMGVQERSTVLELMRAAQDADEGILTEQRDVLGIRLVQRASLYNQTAAFTMDYTGDDGLVSPLDPVDDVQQVTNDVTVNRDGGSSARVTLDSGALSTQAPPDGIGLYDTAATINLYDDTQPAQHASWRLHIGTWDETRFPQVTVNLAGAAGSIEAAAAVDVGSRIQITNPPVWLPPDTLDLLVQGYSEVLANFEWTITYNCTPYGPWSIGHAGDDDTAVIEAEFAWADTEGAELAEALTATETDVDVLTTSGPTWTDDVADMPFDWRVGGEVMTVTAPHSLINDNPFATTDLTGWTDTNATLTRSTSVVHPHPAAVASVLVTPDGGANCTVRIPQTAVGSVAPQTAYVMSWWVHSDTGWNGFTPQINWYQADGTYISTSSGTTADPDPGVWTYVTVTATAPALASRTIGILQQTNTPAATDEFYVWAGRITRTKSSASYDNFGRTASSGWGTADSGAAWTNTGGAAANYAVGSGYGSHTLASVDVSRRTSLTAASADCDIYCDVATDQLATGNSLYGGLMARHADVDNLYTARIQFLTTQAIVLTLRKRVTGTETELATFTTRLTHVAGTFYRLRFQVFGSELKARLWEATGLEPAEWQVEATDTALTAAQSWGCRSITFTGNTNVNPAIRYDNFDVITPQTFTVTRSVNGVSKTHSAGADVALAHPAYAAL